MIGSGFASRSQPGSPYHDGWRRVEQRKVLLIIVSVTIVIAVTIGVGMWLFYPRDQVEPDAIADSGGMLEWEPLDYLRGVGERPGLEISEPDPTDDELVVTYGVVEEEPEPRATRPDRIITDETPPVRPDATPVEPAPVEPSPVESRPTEPAPVAAVPEPTPAPVAEPRAPVTRPAPAPPASPELSDRAYWVQVISSPNRDTVEQAQRVLREHQLGTRIVTRVVEGTLFYRLRLGPFAVRAEAEKFLGWVRQIEGYADSMIFVDYTTAVSAAPRR